MNLDTRHGFAVCFRLLAGTCGLDSRVLLALLLPACGGRASLEAESNSGLSGGNSASAAGGNSANAAGGNSANAAGGNSANAAGGNSANAAGGNSANAAGGNSADGVGGGSADTPVVNYVSPYVAYLGEQLGVVIRGTNFSATATVSFGEQLAARVEVLSDTEIYAIPPPISVPSRLALTVSNATATAASRADFVVREHPQYAYATLTTGVGRQGRALYDAERDAVFSFCGGLSDCSPSPSAVHRYAYDQNSGTWIHSSVYVPDLGDIALSPDGKYLLALGRTRLWLLDPMILSTLDYVELEDQSLGWSAQMGVANDGKVLLLGIDLSYSLAEQRFTPITFRSTFGPVFSADGSRAVMGEDDNSHTQPFSIYDASTGLFSASQLFEYFVRPSLSRNGSRCFSAGKLYDRNLKLIGGIATSTGYMNTSGTQAYELDLTEPTPTHRTLIHAYDLSGNGPNFPALPDLELPDPINGGFLVSSLDSRYLFLPGSDKFMVVPVP